MGIGGSGGIFSRKTELVADLTSAFRTLNAELQKTRDLSAEISRNLKTARGGGGDLFDTSSHSSGTKDPSQNDGSQGGGSNINNGGFGLSNILNFAGKAVSAGLQAMPTLQNSFAQNLSASQAGFRSGVAGFSGNLQQSYLANNGTFAGGQQDVYQAQRLMTNYSMQGTNAPVFQANVAAMSNLSPGITGEQAVNAVQSLNSGKSVNMLRMIGVNIRGSNGMMRDFKDIAKDLWNVLTRSTGGKTPTKDQINFSLQPGNFLYRLMDAYFGQDQILRDSVTNELYLLAGSGGSAAGAPITRSLTQSQGLSTAATNSQAKLVASQLGSTQAAAPFELKGLESANSALTTLNTKFSELVKQSAALQKILEGKGFLDTMAQAGNGSGGGIMGGLTNFGGSFLGSLLGGKSGSGALKKMGSWFASKASSILPSIEKAGLTAAEVSAGALEEGAGAALSPFSAGTSIIASTALTAGTIALFEKWKNSKGKGGQGGDDTSTVMPGMSRPLAGNPQITSPFGVVRYLNTNQGHNATYGKPHGGVDFGVAEGTPVFAVKDGELSSLTDPTGFGTYASIRQNDGKTSIYGHLSRVGVPSGQNVRAGDLIGYSGNTGNSTGAHLHFEMRDGATKLDPLNYLEGATSAPDSSGGATAHPIYGSLKAETSNGSISLVKGGEGDTAATVNGVVNNKNLGHASSINYGGVNITMNFPAGTYNKEEIKSAVREVISYDSIRKHAVSQ
jgi:murein DD-endopeptidase MepM/ murein hydrolase activator NlpD